jgi:adenine-specific DNA-methyltransferase
MMTMQLEFLKNTVQSISERPTVFADNIGRTHAEHSSEDHKKEFGQYLTPVAVADFMADMISIRNMENISILDPGIGSSVLTCAVCEALLRKNQKIRSINIVGYEVDFAVLKQTQKALEYLEIWLLNPSSTLIFPKINKNGDFALKTAFLEIKNPKPSAT